FKNFLNLSNEIASINNYLGIFKRNQSYLTEALFHFFTALKVADSLDIKIEIGYAHNNIGDIYRRLHNDTLAIKNFTKALDIFREIKHERGIAYCYNQLSLLYINIKDYDKALYFNKKSIKLRKLLNDWVGIAANYRNSGDIYLLKNDFVMSEAYYDKSLKLDLKYDEKYGLGYTYNHIGRLYNLKGRYNDAIPIIKKGLKIGTDLGSPKIINAAAEYLSNSYEALGDFKKAFEYYKLFKQTNDSLYSEENTKNITQLTMQFEFDRIQLQKELKAEEKLEKQKLIRNISIAGFLIMIIMVFIVLRSYKQKIHANNLLKHKNQQINQQKEELIHINNQLKKRENELYAANLTKDKFSSIIAHDLKSPFNVIFGFTKLLYEDIDDYDMEAIKDFLIKILSVTDNAYKLLQNLLDWSMTQTGEFSFNPEHIDCHPLLIDIIKLLESSANEKSIKISNEVQPQTIVYADKNMLSTIFRNLISNAIKFTPRKGELSISMYREKYNIVFVFSDKGIGINKNNIEKLFKIDEEFKTDGTEKEKGTGLGLILCKEFVEKHKGKLWVESIVGEGSKFYVSFPLK
ncbi:MAG: sensor histidine kinase, partial [Chlorobi bacterium]|nr:sensor histidine kinase [Chlorobiota bacterium]